MTQAIVIVKKIGKDYWCEIPKQIASSENIQPGDEVEFTIKKIQ